MRQSKILGLLLGLFLMQPLLAQDEAAESNAEAAQDASAADQSDGGTESSGQAEADDDGPAYADDLNDFIPSSEVPPDEQLTFPVDI
jgi:hypothetical protein